MKRAAFFIALLLLTMTGCSEKRTDPSNLINKEASPPGNLPFDPLQWKVISSFINRRDSTMSVLYGNDLAVTHARTMGTSAYPPGSILSLITWKQKDDAHWYGAMIPGQIKSIEFVDVKAASSGQLSNFSQDQEGAYHDYEGVPLQEITVSDSSTLNARINFILSQKAAAMP
jgi:hypothetical protein